MAPMTPPGASWAHESDRNVPRPHRRSIVGRIVVLRAATPTGSASQRPVVVDQRPGLATAPDATADVLDVGRPGWVRIVGLALLPFAAFVAWLSTASTTRLRLHTPGIVAGDIGWVVGSVVTLLLGWYSGIGIALVIAMAATVDLFALVQWRAWRGMPD